MIMFLVTLLLGKVLDCDLKLIERVLHTEEVVKIEGEIRFHLLLFEITLAHVRVALCLIDLHFW